MTARMGAFRSGLFAIAVLALTSACSAPGAGSPVPTSTVDLPPSYKFEPAAITIKAGTTVIWTNHDNFTHSVQFLDGGLPKDPMVMQPGQKASFKFTRPGLYHYQCSFHPQNMQGTVLVTSA